MSSVPARRDRRPAPDHPRRTGLHLTHVTGIWVYLKGGAFHIDNFRAE
ncbi:hypothetical protein WME91_53755 [Sorangium sp. So ce269]